jgi:hypothetical protein
MELLVFVGYDEAEGCFFRKWPTVDLSSAFSPLLVGERVPACWSFRAIQQA